LLNLLFVRAQRGQERFISFTQYMTQTTRRALSKGRLLPCVRYNKEIKMTKVSNYKVQVILDTGFEGAVVRGNVRIEFNASGGVDVYAPVVIVHPAVNDSTSPPAKVEPKVGDTMPDGMKYAGISPDTGKPFYVDAADAPGTYMFNQAANYAASHGKRVPSCTELDVLFNNRAAIGGFNQTGSSVGWYWSSTEDRDYAARAWAQSFDYGDRNTDHMSDKLSLRLVRR
jgi:hypothetical protein